MIEIGGRSRRWWWRRPRGRDGMRSRKDEGFVDADLGKTQRQTEVGASRRRGNATERSDQVHQWIEWEIRQVAASEQSTGAGPHSFVAILRIADHWAFYARCAADASEGDTRTEQASPADNSGATWRWRQLSMCSSARRGFCYRALFFVSRFVFPSLVLFRRDSFVPLVFCCHVVYASSVVGRSVRPVFLSLQLAMVSFCHRTLWNKNSPNHLIKCVRTRFEGENFG